MKIIDFHFHYMPKCIDENIVLKNMDSLGIEKAVVLPIPDHPRYSLLEHTGTNEKVLELCRKYPERFIPSVYVEPRNVLEAQTQLQRAYDNGIRIVKMWPGHGFSPDDPMISPVWEKMNSLKMAVLFHSGSLGVRTNLPLEVRRSTGFNAKYGQPFLLDSPARCFPDITFIIAHAAYPWTLEALEMAFMFPNIYIDFSCGLGYEGYNIINKLRPGRISWDKFLFGSDTAGTAGEFIEKWSEFMKEPFFAPHAEDFFYNNAKVLLQKLNS
jgi:predicted TIM-barrel fold metal-dependent hydrolase